MPKILKTIEEKESPAERAFMTRWRQFTTLDTEPEREYLFDKKTGDWRFDFAWPVSKIAVEIEGGTWLKKGGHTTGNGYEKDCEKYNRAAELGWRVLRYTPQMVEYAPDEVIQQIDCAISGTFRITFTRIKR